MIWNHLFHLIRSSRQNPLAFTVNFVGLVTGLLVFAFTYSLSSFERNHDRNWVRSERIYVPAVRISETAGFMAGRLFRSFYTGFAPVAAERTTTVEAAARAYREEFPMRIGGEAAMQPMRFADPAFFQIFDLEFLAGDTSGFGAPGNALVSDEFARRHFGSPSDAVGSVIEINQSQNVRVTGVYAMPRADSHLTRAPAPGESRNFDIFLSIRLFEALTSEPVEGNWTSLNSDQPTYILLKEGVDPAAARAEINALFEAQVDERGRRFAAAAEISHISEMNLENWRSAGMPSLDIVLLVGLLILAIAVINSVSLNTARAIDRTREIGLRRAMGARQSDLLTQFLIEGQVLAGLAVAAAILILTWLTPWFARLIEQPLDVGLMLSAGPIAVIVGTAAASGLLSGLYPVIASMWVMPNAAMGVTRSAGGWAAWLRKGLAALQFGAVGALALAVVVSGRQNAHLMSNAPTVDTANVYALRGFFRDEHRALLPGIRDRVAALPGVVNVSMTSIVPFDDMIMLSDFHTDETSASPRSFQIAAVDSGYFDIFKMPVAWGRNLDEARGGDLITAEEMSANEFTANVVIDEAAVSALGFESPGAALGEEFRRNRSEGVDILTVVGVVPTLNYRPFSREAAYPFVYMLRPTGTHTLAIEIAPGTRPDFAAIDRIWRNVAPLAPASLVSLGEIRDASYRVLSALQSGFMAIALIAALLAGSGLYALSAYLAATRRHEMAVRKVMGADTARIAGLMIWQFSKPVILSLLIGLPLGYLAMSEYLAIYPDRIDISPWLLVEAAVITLLLAGATVGEHAARTARTRPAEVLKYE